MPAPAWLSIRKHQQVAVTFFCYAPNVVCRDGDLERERAAEQIKGPRRAERKRCGTIKMTLQSVPVQRLRKVATAATTWTLGERDAFQRAAPVLFFHPRLEIHGLYLAFNRKHSVITKGNVFTRVHYRTNIHTHTYTHTPRVLDDKKNKTTAVYRKSERTMLHPVTGAKWKRPAVVRRIFQERFPWLSVLVKSRRAAPRRPRPRRREKIVSQTKTLGFCYGQDVFLQCGIIVCSPFKKQF